MKTCSSCGRENADDQDFCECGEYLRWDPTQYIPTIKPSESSGAETTEQAAAVPGQAAPRGTHRMRAAAVQRGAIDPVTIELGVPGSEAPPGGPVVAHARPGEKGVLKAKVRNQSGIVDNYELRVEGLDPGWWSTDPETVYLVPFGTAGTYEEEIEIHFHPPRSADAEARTWELQVVVVSKAQGRPITSAPASLTVDPFEEVEAEVRPSRRRARFGARYALGFTNRANSPVELELSAADKEQAMRYRFTREMLELKPGERLPNRVTVRPRRQRIFGRPAEHTVEIAGTPTGAEEPAVTREVTFVQRAWIPPWLLIALPLLLAFALVIWLLLPSNTTVPDLTAAKDMFEAQKLVDEAELTLNPVPLERVTTGAEIGTILDQTPAAGEELEKGEAVTVELGVGSGEVEVPDVQGLSPVDAALALEEESLILGTVQPPPADPAAALIDTQVPEAGEQLAAGLPVNVFVSGGGEAGEGEGGGGEGEGGEGAIPSIAGLSAAAAAAALAEAGLTPETVSVVDESEPGTVVGTEPGEGAELPPGSLVRLLVSAGFPLIAVDDGTNVSVLDATSGEPVAELTDSDEGDEQPAWTPDGAAIAWRSEGTIMLGDPEGESARAITRGGDFHTPAFAPDEGRQVLALTRRKGGNGDLCFMRVPDGGAGRPRCISEPGLDVGRQISWAPDGRSLLAFASDADDVASFGLRLYRSNRPFSARPADWSRGKTVTDDSRPGFGAISGAISPDGEQLAVVANFGSLRQFRVFLTSAEDFALDEADVVAPRGCEVAWRTDGLELLVTQRDARCSSDPTGDLVRIDPRSPAAAGTLATGIAHIAWQPLNVDR